MTIVAWVSASWVLSSLIAVPLIGRFMQYGLGEGSNMASARDRAPLAQNVRPRNR
jgi:hypothetical protein